MKSLLLALTALTTPALSQTYQPDQAALKAHVGFLASDELKGREAGTPEYDIAARYVASQFEAMGLKPAGDKGSYLQSVPLVTFRPAKEGSTVLRRSESETPLQFGVDFLPSSNPVAPEVAKEAEVVFVGFGISAPEFGRDDYAGVDVRGKIVAYLGGTPKNLPSEEGAHYGNTVTKRTLAAQKGAIGTITVYTPTRQRVSPFEWSARNWRSFGATWADKNGAAYYPGGAAPGLGTLSLSGAQKLFGAREWARISKAAESKTGRVGHLNLPGTVRVAYANEIVQRPSSNVVGLIEGSDPALKNEYVVMTAHLDHVGVGVPVNGDAIYNGAMDNAVGTASLIEVAHGFKHLQYRPKRSILFVAVTAEEKGLVGADYFAQNPTVPKAAMVANVNLDMPIITYDFRDVVAFGAERSTIGDSVRRAGAPLGVTLVPDPEPEQGIFTRSDHYRFVQQGIPSVFIVTGPGGDGARASAAFEKDHYHQPSDEANDSIRYDVGAKFVSLNMNIVRELADAPDRPRWKQGDFFGRLYNGYGAVDRAR